MDAQTRRDVGLCEPRASRATCFFRDWGLGDSTSVKALDRSARVLRFLKNIFLSLAVLGLRGRPQAFSHCSEGAPEHRLSRCGSRAWFLCGAWELPGLGIELTSSALTGGLLPTAPQSQLCCFMAANF